MVMCFKEAVLEIPLPEYEYESLEEEKKKKKQEKTQCRLMIVEISEDTYFKFPI